MKQLYSRFLAAAPGRLHFAAHSHHYWMDCTREAQLRYWDDSARLTDHKWSHLMSEVLPKARASIAGILGLSDPTRITVAPNTHEFVARLLSCLEPGKPARIVTTSSEFYSFARQAERFAELPGMELHRVDVEPFETFEARFVEKVRGVKPDFTYLSQVFFDSGLAVPMSSLAAIARAAPADSIFVVDGYHAFCAVPTDLSSIEQRVFYLAGGYKYAQSGEGACFLHVPRDCRLRPIDTGWFAQVLELGHSGGARQIAYPETGDRFAGSTFDPSGWYRFNAVMDEWSARGITVERVHEHVRALQKRFIAGLEKSSVRGLSARELIGAGNLEKLGHFLTFRTLDAGDWVNWLKERNVVVDSRQDRLRFGFGSYQDEEDVDRLLEMLASRR